MKRRYYLSIAVMEQWFGGPKMRSQWFVPFEGRMLTFGRSPYNEVVLSDPAVSSIHGRVYQSEGELYLEDLHSTNGCFINRFQIEPGELVRIREGDAVKIGTLGVCFELLEDEQMATERLYCLAA